MPDTALASWNDGPAKQAIIDFVTSATTPGAGFVEIADRIATFDNDGTLWVEQPLPPQFDFVFRRWAEEVKADPSLAEQQPYKPMLELLDYLRAHEFRPFVVSGGGRDFMRVFAEQAFGVLKEHVIGTAVEYSYADGKIVRGEHAVGGLNVRAGKPEHIFATTGRLPAFAGGNADVDIEMLEAATFSVLVKHDDEEREFAYTSGAEASLARAKELGWTVVSMKNDWSTVFSKGTG